MMAVCVVVRGPLGVGKSTIAGALAARIGAVHFSMDKVLEENGLEEWDRDRVSLKSFLRANELIARQTLSSLAAGRSVVIDGCFYWRQQVEDIMERIGRQCLVFTLEAPLSLCIERDGKRPVPPQGTGPVGGMKIGREATEFVYKITTEVRAGIPVDARGEIEATVSSILGLLPWSARSS